MDLAVPEGTNRMQLAALIAETRLVVDPAPAAAYEVLRPPDAASTLVFSATLAKLPMRRQLT
ncbi:hypothetical protein ABCR94_02455 [Streptomyces sp. 21So2-11]|uniref:hypothetical protein n=1 Tax=Streptomyces sp. 21So2-11 TaxID=3144408 RepID=UPI00321C3018